MQLTLRPHRQSGLTLVELIVTVAILAILAWAVVPLARFRAKREKERELRYDLWQMRDAIDRYKDAADRHAFQTKVDSQNYPPDLDTLVKGVDPPGQEAEIFASHPGGSNDRQSRVEHALHAGRTEQRFMGWQNLFDVASKSQATALDGTKYSDW